MKSKTVKYLLATGVMLAAASWTTVASARAACPKWMCGSNSPVLEGAAIEGRAFRRPQSIDGARGHDTVRKPVMEGSRVAR